MPAIPDVDQVIAVARSLGMSLGAEEAKLYRDRVVQGLLAIEEFMRTRIDEDRPPLLSPARAPGHRPTTEEDPFHAWLWKCEIKAATEGLLADKTVSFKDHTAVAGMPLTLGTYLMEGYTADFDATVVTRVLAAGGTVIGKNSMDGPASRWGWGVLSDYQRPLNPHDPEHWTGGSSSGSAAAVAAGEVDVAFGGDQGGSIRIPAAYCGTYGLKPTYGLVPHFGIGFGSDQSVDSCGPMARNVEDVAAALQAVAGYDPYDPRQDRSVPPQIDALGPLAQGVRGLRIGLLEEGFANAEPDVRDVVLAAVDVLTAAGADATWVSVPEHLGAREAARDGLDPEGARAIFDIGFFGAFAKTYYPATFIAATYHLFHQHADDIRATDKLNLILSEFSRRRFHGTVYAKAQNVRGYYKKAFDRALAQVDVIAMPTVHQVAPKYEERHVAQMAEPAFDLSRTAWNTKPYNYTGHPALSVPCGKSGRLPIGMQLVGAHYADPLLLRTAYAFQHSTDWDVLTKTHSGVADPRIPAARPMGGSCASGSRASATWAKI